MTTIRGHIHGDVPFMADDVLRLYCEDVTWVCVDNADFTVEYDRSLWLNHDDWGFAADLNLNIREQALYLGGVIDSQFASWQYDSDE